MPRQGKAKEQRMKRGQACLNCNSHHRACEGGIPCHYCVKTGSQCKRRSTAGPPQRTTLRRLAMKPPADTSDPSSSTSQSYSLAGVSAPPQRFHAFPQSSLAGSGSERGASRSGNAHAGPSRRSGAAEEAPQASTSQMVPMPQEVPQPLLDEAWASTVSMELLETIDCLPESLTLSPSSSPIAGVFLPDIEQVRHFVEVEDHPVGAHAGILSLPAIISKGTTLLRQAVHIYTAFHSPLPTPSFAYPSDSTGSTPSATEDPSPGLLLFEYHRQSCDLLVCLRWQLQRLESPEGQDRQYRRSFGLAWALYSAATLVMYRMFVEQDPTGETHGICARSAQVIVEFGHTFVLGGDASWTFGPAYGVLVAMACRLLTDLWAMESQRAKAGTWISGVLVRGIGALECLAASSSLLREQLAAVREWLSRHARP